MSLLTRSPEREQARLEAERLRIEQDRLRAEARRAREVDDAEHRAEVERRTRELAADERERSRARWTERRSQWTDRTRAVGRLAVMSTTNLGVNIVAVAGQFLVFQALGWPTPTAVMAAAIVESVAVYVSWHAHVALREGDSAFRLRMTSYLIGAAAAYLNYSHVPQTPELFAACSLASPWLWSMHSRHLHRKDLREQSLIDPRAPKFSVLRWALHRKETFAAFKWAVGEGVQSPQIAVDVIRTRRNTRMAWQSVEDAQTAVIAAQRAQLELSLTQLAAVSQELHGMDPDAAAAMDGIARFVNRVGAGLVPEYRPAVAGVLESADETRTNAPDEARTNVADGTQTDGERKSARRPSSARTKSAGGQSRTRGRAAVTAADGGRTNGRTVRASVSGRTTRTGGRSAGTDDVSRLLGLGRNIRAEHERNGVNLTRDRLSAALKGRGLTISNDRAGRLLALVRADASSATDSADETASSAQENDTADGGPSGTEHADETASSAN
ncbi:hypothetical protein GCM10023194_81450 [Planotetraspora phitsanulokensis]|uniref:DUF2637 domain-containing protein n=1 Tax=Planotetraspora phitsanulokensis TaxID=575192 RepID=A0A8J3XNJ5_9ACTN|nr:DUF2637 domain-containing protein [Planotetraspora phitsanulokensis]GII42903.1 hypothetical protein Pph01_79060 [Planotetraspora phitsanulokensis]